MSKRRQLNEIRDAISLLACKVDCLAHTLHIVEAALNALIAALDAKQIVGIGVNFDKPTPRPESPKEGVS